MTSIFTRDLSGGLAVTPRELIAHEISHLEGMGRSRWKTTPFMATCRTVGAVVFVALLVLYFLDPVLMAINKTESVSAYLYLSHAGSPAQVEKLRNSGIFTARDLQMLDIRVQTVDAEAVKNYYAGTLDAERSVQRAVDYMAEVNGLHSGRIAHVSPLTKVRYYLFTSVGVIPPREWLALNPVIETN